MGYGKQTEHTSGGLSDTFQTMGRQSDFRLNHRWVYCNYTKKIDIWRVCWRGHLWVSSLQERGFGV